MPFSSQQIFYLFTIQNDSSRTFNLVRDLAIQHSMGPRYVCLFQSFKCKLSQMSICQSTECPEEDVITSIASDNELYPNKPFSLVLNADTYNTSTFWGNGIARVGLSSGNCNDGDQR